MRICAVQFYPVIGNIPANIARMLSWIELAQASKADVILFPECALSGYLPLDQIFNPSFLKEQTNAIELLKSKSKNMHVLFGGISPAETSPKKFFNTYYHCHLGSIQKTVFKTKLPNDDIFQDSRFFIPNPHPGKSNLISLGDMTLGVGICEDMWHSPNLFQQIDKAGTIDLWVCPSASPYASQKINQRMKQIKNIISSTHHPFLFLNQVGSYDGILFDGSSTLVNEQNKIQAQLNAFQEEALIFELTPPQKLLKSQMQTTQLTHPLKLKPHIAQKSNRTKVESLARALEFGTYNFVKGCGLKKTVVCISGGLDSAITLLVAKRALGANACQALILPSRHNKSQVTLDAIALCIKHKISHRTISIEPFYKLFRSLCFREFKNDTSPAVFENLQARIRGVIAMIYTNQLNAILLGTSNKSELTMGYATLYGDLCAGLLVLGDVLKSQVYSLAKFYTDSGEFIPKGILKRPPSAELSENQKDTDALPPYDELDPAITSFLNFEYLNSAKITPEDPLFLRLQNALQKSQFKRKQTAPILKVSDRDLSKGRNFIISGG
jgi:NAD+ synthase (glutamine-hydrolysing)